MTEAQEKILIEKLGKIVDDSKRLLLVLPVDGAIEIHADYFTLYDTQKLFHLLQRTPEVEWWIKPIDQYMVKLRIRKL